MRWSHRLLLRAAPVFALVAGYGIGAAPPARADAVCGILSLVLECEPEATTESAPSLPPVPAGATTSSSTSGASSSSAPRSAGPRPRVVTVTAKPDPVYVVVKETVTAPPVPQPVHVAPSAPRPVSAPRSGRASGIWSLLLLAPIGTVLGAWRAGRRGRRAREEAASSQANVETLKRDLLANVSHELRTPLTPVKGYAALLMRERMPAARTKEIAGRMLNAADRLDRTVDLLVSHAALQQGEFDLYKDDVDLHEIARSVVRAAAASEDGRVTLDWAGRRPRIAGNERLVRLALEQLVDNAVKFSPAGSPVRLSGFVRDETLEIAVRDEGPGIPAESLARMFSDFEQFDSSSTRKHGGLGLGLAFAMRVARSYGGTIGVVSTPGAGSTFTLTLPLLVGVPSP
jgi:signal transduction histidine kinase